MDKEQKKSAFQNVLQNELEELAQDALELVERLVAHMPADKVKEMGITPRIEAVKSAMVKMRGGCPEKAKPGGCQLHNLQCGYPECDR